jgi:predicted PurR-regulated permease PerM
MERSRIKKILRVIMILAFLLILYASRSVIKPVMLSLITAYLLNPLVKLLQRKGLKKRNAVIISIMLLIIIFAIGIFFVIPGVIKDVLGILGNTDIYKSKLSSYIGKIGYNRLPNYLKNVLDSSIAKGQIGIKNGLNNFFNGLIRFTMEIPAYTLVPIFVYYFLMDNEHFINTIKCLLSPELRKKLSELWIKIDIVLGSYIRSRSEERSSRPGPGANSCSRWA